MAKMRSHTIWINVILINYLLVTSCTSRSQQNQVNTPSTKGSVVDNFNNELSVLFNQCKVPCWLGITPGQTTGDDAVKLLKKHYGQENVNTVDPNFIRWVSNNVDISEGGDMGLLDNVVTDIYVLIPRNKLSVNDLFQVLEEPDLVFAANAFTSDNKCLSASLFYSKDGIDASLYPIGDSVGVQKMQFISSLSFLSPRLAVQWQPTDSIITKWVGYHDYCQK